MIPSTTLWAISAIVGVGVFVSSAELLASRADYTKGGLFDCLILRERPRFQRPDFLGRWSKALYCPPTLICLAGLSGLAAAGLVWPALSDEMRGLFALLALFGAVGASAFFAPALDGADQMTRVVLAGVTVAGLFAGSLWACTCAMVFIAAQSCLAYSASGVAKLLSTGWRSGETFPALAGTELFGHRAIFTWLRAHPRMALGLTWMMIGWECAFPLVLVAPPAFLLMLLGTGAVFHLLAARAMGLNNFVWPFLATYPAIIETNRMLRHWL